MGRALHGQEAWVMALCRRASSKLKSRLVAHPFLARHPADADPVRLAAAVDVAGPPCWTLCCSLGVEGSRTSFVAGQGLGVSDAPRTRSSACGGTSTATAVAAAAAAGGAAAAVAAAVVATREPRAATAGQSDDEPSPVRQGGSRGASAVCKHVDCPLLTVGSQHLFCPLHREGGLEELTSLRQPIDTSARLQRTAGIGPVPFRGGAAIGGVKKASMVRGTGACRGAGRVAATHGPAVAREGGSGSGSGSTASGEQWTGDFNLREAEHRFKCMHPGKKGCKEGGEWTRPGKPGAYHDIGTRRVAFKNPLRNHYDAFCPAHFASAKPHHAEVMAEWNQQRKVDAAKKQAKGTKKKKRAADAPPTAVIGEDIAGARQVRRRGLSKATTAAISKEKALLQQSFPRQAPLRKDDDDLSAQLTMREQRHKVMETEEVNSIVREVVMGHLEGMPQPTRYGFLSRVTQPWTDVDTNSMPLLPLGCPIKRAEKHLPRDGRAATEAAKKKILREFVVSGTVAIFAPEVLCRRALLRDPLFTRKVEGPGGAQLGVQLPCPRCRSNKHTRCSNKWNGELRAVHSSKGSNIIVVSRRYRCFNPMCAEVANMVKHAMKGTRGDGKLALSGEEKREVTPDERARMREGDISTISPKVIFALLRGGWSFSIDDARYMALLPPAVRLRFPFDLYHRGGADDGLLDQTMLCGQSVAAMTHDLTQLYSQDQTQNMMKYAAFTTSEGGMWPSWEAVGEGTLLSPPTRFNMETYAAARYKEVKPYLEDEMRSRGCTKLAWDGTFQAAGQVASEARVLVSLLNEHGHVLGYAAVPSEKWAHVLPMFMGLRDRLLSMDKLDDLETTQSDTCCEGSHDPTRHPTVNLFPSVTRAPYADPFHKVQIITDSMFSGNELYAPACRELGAAIARPSERDQFRCATSMVESGSSAADAVSKAVGPWGKKYVRTFTPLSVDKDLGEWLEKYSKLNDDLIKKGEPPLFRERRGAQASTAEAVANVRKCAKKGCFHSGRTLKEDYSVDRFGPETGLPLVHKSSGTAKCESLHSLINRRVVSQAPKLGPERSDRELAYLFKWHNDRIDVRRGLRKEDFMRGRSWSEIQAKAMWNNIDGPAPGGNQQLRYTAEREAPTKEGLWSTGKEVFGHEYLKTLQDHNLRECAKLANMDLDDLNKTSFVVQPAEADELAAMEEQDEIVDAFPPFTVTAAPSALPTAPSVAVPAFGAPFSPTAEPFTPGAALPPGRAILPAPPAGGPLPLVPLWSVGGGRGGAGAGRYTPVDFGAGGGPGAGGGAGVRTVGGEAAGGAAGARVRAGTVARAEGGGAAGAGAGDRVGMGATVGAVAGAGTATATGEGGMTGAPRFRGVGGSSSARQHQGAGAVLPHPRSQRTPSGQGRVIHRRPTGLNAKMPSTADEVALANECHSKARSVSNLSEDQVFAHAADAYNVAVCENIQSSNSARPVTSAKKLLGSVTTELFKQWWLGQAKCRGRCAHCRGWYTGRSYVGSHERACLVGSRHPRDGQEALWEGAP